MAEHPDINTSHISDFVEDRGPAEHFHGRTRILDSFKEILERSKQKNLGTTILIQGAPGVGKTALLEEMALNAIENQWDVFEINLGDLHNPVQMAQTLGKSYISYKQTAIKTDAKVVGTEHIKEVAGDSSVSQVLEKMDPKHGIILVLDEAQSIADFVGSPNKTTVVETLGNVHNGKFNHPVILLAAGLGSTEEAFSLLRVSRFKGGCNIELGALRKEDERSVLRDWLIKDGGAKGDPTAWIDAIAEKTHGWPQHLTAYGDAAAKQISHDKGVMTSAGLKVVYQVGLMRRKAYYKQRVASIDGDEFICLSEAIAGIETGQPFKKKFITKSIEKEYNNQEKANELFNTFLEKGLIAEEDGLYSVPIPSMHDWMKSELERIHERLRHAKSVQNKEAAPKSIGPARDLSSLTTIEPEECTIPKLPRQSKENEDLPKDQGSKIGIER